MQFILGVVLSTSLALAMPKAEISGPRYEIDAAGRLTCTNCVYAEGIDPRDPAAELRRAEFEARNPLLQRCLDCFIENPEHAITKRDSIKADDIAPVKRCFACYFWSSAGGGSADFDSQGVNPADSSNPASPAKAKRCFSCYFWSSAGGGGAEFDSQGINPADSSNPANSVNPANPVVAKRCFACYFWSSAGGGGAGFEPDNSKENGLQQRHIQQEWAVPSKRCFVCYFGGGGSGVGGEFEGVTDGKSH